MMDGMRRAGKTLFGRIVIGLLFGFLILSFAIWGIEDMIRNVGQNSVARVGQDRDRPAGLPRRLPDRAADPVAPRAPCDHQRRGPRARARAPGARQDADRGCARPARPELGLAISDDAIVKAITTDASLPGRQRPVRPQQLQRADPRQTATPSRASSASSAPSICASSSPRPSPAPCRPRRSCATPCTATRTRRERATTSCSAAAQAGEIPRPTRRR